jgi:hypothetical protein
MGRSALAPVVVRVDPTVVEEREQRVALPHHVADSLAQSALGHQDELLLPSPVSQLLDNGAGSDPAAPGFPRHIWAVTEDGNVFEAVYGGSRRGVYHGYPVRRCDPFNAEVRRQREKRNA